jgi:glycerophosphoryl diester phosphodiesterase
MADTPSRPLIVAHRGASGYLPEHTLEAKALAYAQGADFLEQDVVVSRDDQLIVLHDIHLDRVTDVAEAFPDRHRDDGRFYVRDFDLAELQSLRVWERFTEAGSGVAVFPQRFPARYGRFRIATLEDELQMVRGLNRASGRQVGIYPEIKLPEWHRGEGVDLSELLLDMLARFDYRTADHPVFVQCFDAAELVRVRREFGCRLRLIQLLGENDWGESGTDYDRARTDAGLRELAQTVDGIGPWIGQLYTLAPIDGEAVSTGLTARARAAGLQVHPYTFRADALAPGFASFEDMVHWFANTLGIDGLFTDFPDLAVNALTRQGA